jgi:hypothetical protein
MRAALYCQLKQAGDHLKAKQIGTRMPFSFLNRDWKKHNANDLIALHNTLIELDRSLKNGIWSGALDHWLTGYLFQFC